MKSSFPQTSFRLQWGVDDNHRHFGRLNDADLLGSALAMLHRMRAALLVQVLLLLSFSFSAWADAGPITGQSLVQVADNEDITPNDEDRRKREQEAAAVAFDAAGLFDGVGLPLLRVSAPIYLQLDLSSQSGDAYGGADLASAGGGGGGLGNMSNPFGSSGGLSAASAQVASVPEPATLFMLAPGVALVARRVIAKRSRR